jgi:hypothetical protein
VLEKIVAKTGRSEDRETLGSHLGKCGFENNGKLRHDATAAFATTCYPESVNLAAILIVTVLGVGGPRYAKPAPLKNATIIVRREIVCAAPSPAHCDPPAAQRVGSGKGKLKIDLAPGGYRVESTLHQSDIPLCAFRQVRLSSGETRHLTLRCSIK